MKYLGITPKHLKVAVFDFTCCEGCELQLANKEDSLVAFLRSMEIVNFREVSSHRGTDYDIALIEGACSRADEVERLEKIRKQAKVVVAFGSCAVYGGVNKMKNAFDLKEVNKEVYGDKPKDTLKVRAIKEVIKVDFEVPGCPVSKAEFERVVQHLLLGVPFNYVVYPVCVECKQKFNVCMFEKGSLCLGPITRAGCDAPCPSGGLGCWGCRGPAEDPNYEEFFKIARERKFSEREIAERVNFYGGFEGVMK